MYQFKIVKNDDCSWRFELGGINLILDGFLLKNEKHYIKNPSKAIAFFSVNDILYGVDNKLLTCPTAEDFYEAMKKQYAYFK